MKMDLMDWFMLIGLSAFLILIFSFFAAFSFHIWVNTLRAAGLWS